MFAKNKINIMPFHVIYLVWHKKWIAIKDHGSFYSINKKNVASRIKNGLILFYLLIIYYQYLWSKVIESTYTFVYIVDERLNEKNKVVDTKYQLQLTQKNCFYCRSIGGLISRLSVSIYKRIQLLFGAKNDRFKTY